MSKTLCRSIKRDGSPCQGQGLERFDGYCIAHAPADRGPAILIHLTGQTCAAILGDIFWIECVSKYVPETCASRSMLNKRWLRRISLLMICLKPSLKHKFWKTTPNIEGALVACYLELRQRSAPSMSFAPLLGQL